jgi:hypothetical protein
MKNTRLTFLGILAAALFPAATGSATESPRRVLSLNGTWQIAEGKNELLIRVGADRDAVGPAIPSGFDFEKERYIPGIFDSVELILSGTPHFKQVQAAPDIAAKTVRVQAILRNDGEPASAAVAFVVREDWVRLLHQRVKEMHWNCLRYCIGFPPEAWYDVADEVGVLIQDEFPIWSHTQETKREELASEYAEWMRELQVFEQGR